MMAGNPNWWSMINGMHPQPPAVTSQFIHGGNPNFSTTPPNPSLDHFPVRSWSQLLLGGLGEERFADSTNQFQNQHKKLDNWEEDQQALINLNPSFPRVPALVDHNHHHHQHVKQEFPQFYDTNNQLLLQPNNPVSSPANSCTTTVFSNSFLNFSGGSGKAVAPPHPAQGRKHHHQNQDQSSEKGNSASSEGVQPKRARVQQSSAQPALKVRKEKLGERITALHQLVSPFGKTDTASVLSEAIGYIRFLQAQIEALSSPYMRNRTTSSAAGNSCTLHLQHSHPAAVADSEGPGVQDLRSRGLCLVPTSFTENVADADGSCCGGADYWAPATYGGGSAF